MGEKEGRKPLQRFRRRGIETQAGAIRPLGREQREAHPHIIYQLASSHPHDYALLFAAHDAMTTAQFPVVIDLEKKDDQVNAIVRASSAERHDQAVQSALFLGITEATRRKIDITDDGRTKQTSLSAEYGVQAKAVANGLLRDLLSNQELYEAFGEYYGGLRWGTDQERFVRQLFLHSTDFDPDFLANNLTGGRLSNLVYRLDVAIPYDQRKDWGSATPAEIFARFPELDYRRLQNESFRASPQGKKLLEEYTKLGGEMLAERQARKAEKDITDDGQIIPRPQIPLTKYPIVEALVVDELAIDGPRPNYHLGPRDVTDLVLDSDSEPAHAALVQSITTRLPVEHRRVIDGPDEFQHKHMHIVSVIREYQESQSDERRHSLLKRDLISIMDAFTGESETVTSVREENVDYRARSRNWRSDGRESDSPDVSQVKDIIKDLIKNGIAAPDPEVVARAEDLIAKYIPNKSNEITLPDALALSRSDLVLVAFDALREVTLGTQPEVFARVGTRIFGKPAIGEQFKRFAEMNVEALQIRNTPEALLALKGIRRYSYSFEQEKNPEEEEARKRFAEVTGPADQLMVKQRREKNELLLTLLGQLTNSGVVTQSSEAAALFEGLVRRVEFSGYQMHELPQEYHSLMQLAHDPHLPEKQKNSILWHIFGKFKYVDSEAEHLLVPVVLDMYQAALGPDDAVRLPTEETQHGLRAITALVSEHGNLFKSASEDQLQTLTKYGKGITAHAERISHGLALEDGQRHDPAVSGQQIEENGILSHLAEAMGQLQTVEAYYQKFLHKEAVKAYPHVYYPWVLDKFTRFWQMMQDEVRPGNNPGWDVRELHRALGDIVQNQLVIREKYTPDFDVIEDGHIDTLVKACYDRMIVPHDIKYNNTVWREGLPFVSQAIHSMPQSLLERMKEQYAGTGFAEYLEKEELRRKEEHEG